MPRSTPVRPLVERLEDRRVPAVFLRLDAFGNLYSQFSGADTAAVAFTEIALNQVQVLSGANNLGTYAVTGNLTAVLGTSAGNEGLAFNLAGNTFAGGVNFQTGNSLGASVSVDGGTVAGNLYVTTAAGDDVVSVGQNAAVSVHGSAVINTGTVGPLFLNDSVAFGQAGGCSVQGNLIVANAETVTLSGLAVGGVASLTGPGSGLPDTFSLTGATTVGGSLIVQTGNGPDTVTLAAGTVVSGSAILNLGNSGAGAGPDTASALGTVVGNLAVIDLGGATNILSGTVGGSVYVSAGSGPSNVALSGLSVGGTSIEVVGGNGGTTFNVNALSASHAHLTAVFGTGNDTVNFDVTATTLAGAYLDGGLGTNTFNQTGTINFPNALRNF
jgi:hypothetical protein